MKRFAICVIPFLILLGSGCSNKSDSEEKQKSTTAETKKEVALQQAVSVPIDWPPQIKNAVLLLPTTQGDSDLVNTFNVSMSGLTKVAHDMQLGMPMDDNEIKEMFEGYDRHYRAKGESGFTKDEIDAKVKKDSFKIDLEWISTLNNCQMIARGNSWSKVYNESGSEVGWGVLLTKGQLIIKKSDLVGVNQDIVFPNSYALQECSEEYCVLLLREEENDKLFVLVRKSDNTTGVFLVGNLVSNIKEGKFSGGVPKREFIVVPNAKSARVYADSSVFESKANGWFLGNRNAQPVGK